METKNLIKHLKNGSEIVIISDDPDTNSAIFWTDRAGVIYSFTREFGVMERSDLTFDRLEKHLKNMDAENAHIFFRGYR